MPIIPRTQDDTSVVPMKKDFCFLWLVWETEPFKILLFQQKKKKNDCEIFSLHEIQGN